MIDLTKSEIVGLAELLAEELHAQADERQQRAMDAETARNIPEATREEWAMSFAASYQVLRGIALALDATIERATLKEHSE